MHHNRYLAKSNPEETIQQHTDNLLKQLEILKSIYPKINVNFDLLYYACLYHDLGKISISFQKKVDKNLSDSITNNEEFPHGVLSTLFIDTKKLRNNLNPKIRNTDGGVFVCQNTQKNLK
ncbi:CRISPR-associated endonuclease Cas3'' [Finegoldia magna]|uniref:CRISPR-associated endonuclease Cas3'' n=2 Tax=Finegoldia magna TaxID=1260 RepID=UPI000D852009|nr:CRISPR-associated endonuclease Cas3'' [Finegoldia magna]MCC3310325.1 CRISPR-associated endonuclease Cas3'' [Finegoldia magna]PWV46876.1 CRISPR-associated endonuclease Cas3-HD [Finegoldia magna]